MDKVDLKEYLLYHPEICKLFDINKERISDSLINLKTSNPNKITYPEFVCFLKNASNYSKK